MPSRAAAAAAGIRNQRPYFPRADWLWTPIAANPTLDPQSAGIVTNLASGSHVCDLVEFGVALKPQSAITPSTTRHDIFFTNQTGNGGGNWGPDPFPTSMPIPAGTALPPGSDSHLSVIDGASNKSYSLWQAALVSGSWRASWGGWADLNGDGRENPSGSSTGAGLGRYGAVITVAEIAAGRIDHALFFSTTIARSTVFRYPAVKTDGAAGSATNTIMEGTRVQLDPTINLAAISGITAAELAIGRALQKYGAYCGDNGGAKMAFLFELASDNGGIGGTPGSVYSAAGLTADYFGLTHIPWSSLRVLNSWDAAGGTAPAVDNAISAVGTRYQNVQSTGTTTLSVTPVNAGGLLMLTTAVNSSSINVASVSGGGVTNWARAAVPRNLTFNGRNIDMWFGKITTAGAATITVTPTASVSGVRVDLIAQEFSAAHPSDWAVDYFQYGSRNNTTAATAMTFPTLTPRTGQRLYVGYGVSAGSGTTTGTSGYTVQLDNASNPFIYNTDVSTAQSPTVTQSGSAQNGTVAVLIAACPTTTPIGISDSFTTIDTAKWTAAAAAVAVGGRLAIPCVSGYDNLTSQTSYNLTGKSAHVELVQPANLPAIKQPYRSGGVNIPQLGTAEASPSQLLKDWEIDSLLDKAVQMGAHWVRSHTLGASVGATDTNTLVGGVSGTGSSPTITYRSAVWDRIDYAVAAAAKRGLRLVVPMVDEQHYYNGGKNVWVNFRRPGTCTTDPNVNAGNSSTERTAENFFYTDTQIVADFRQYTSDWLNHVNAYTGRANKDEPAIAIIEVGNELWTAHQDAPTFIPGWAQFVKGIAPSKAVMDGGYDGATIALYGNVATSAYVDVMGIHPYQSPSTSTNADSLGDSAATNSKAFTIGEYPWALTDGPSCETVARDNPNTIFFGPWRLANDDDLHNGGAPSEGGPAYGTSVDQPLYYPGKDATNQAAITRMLGISTSMLDSFSGSASALFILDAGSGNHVRFEWQSGYLYARSATTAGGQVDRGTPTPYHPYWHRWLRISESGGLIMWETSPGGKLWTLFASWAPTFSVAAVTPVLQSGLWSTDATPGTVLFDNFNIAPSGA